jgi:hypothetical protein
VCSMVVLSSPRLPAVTHLRASSDTRRVLSSIVCGSTEATCGTHSVPPSARRMHVCSGGCVGCVHTESRGDATSRAHSAGEGELWESSQVKSRDLEGPLGWGGRALGVKSSQVKGPRGPTRLGRGRAVA